MLFLNCDFRSCVACLISSSPSVLALILTYTKKGKNSQKNGRE
nr:MAG TPA: hypothetical protein [Caudoviricetes sp.]